MTRFDKVSEPLAMPEAVRSSVTKTVRANVAAKTISIIVLQNSSIQDN
jgi:hypothetical protein